MAVNNAFVENEGPYAGIPDKMFYAKRFVLWKLVPDKKDFAKKGRKVPYYASGKLRSGKLDTPEDLAQLVDCEKALAAYLASLNQYAGIGFALGADGTGNHWQGIDFDHLDAHPELLELIGQLPGYLEVSPSGEGVHAIGYGRSFPPLGSNSSGIEAYSYGRYFTVTGDSSSGEPEDVCDYVETILVPLHGAGTLTGCEFKPKAAGSSGKKKKPSKAQVALADYTMRTEKDLTPEDVENLRVALTFISNRDRSLWVKVGMALKNCGEAGKKLWLAWTKTWSGYAKSQDADDLKTWESFAPNDIDYRLIFNLAADKGWINFGTGSKKSDDEKVYTDEPFKRERENSSNDNLYWASFNEILDSDCDYCNVDLLRYVDDDHLLKRLSVHTSEKTNLPINTVFLTGLSVCSGMAARKFVALYKYGDRLPLGLYVTVEHPSGTSKSWCLTTFQVPFFKIHKEVLNAARAGLMALDNLPPTGKLDEEKITEQQNLAAKIKGLGGGKVFISNATPEGLEKVLVNTGGFFNAVSSEQGLFNSLLGNCYKSSVSASANNNDIQLNGFDGGFVNSLRAGREGYHGHVVGAITCFAQPGSIEKVLDASKGTGLAERFLFLTEKSNLGNRDYLKEVKPDYTLDSEYEAACYFFKDTLERSYPFDELVALKISDTGHHYINLYRNLIEPHRGKGKYAHTTFQGTTGKLDMQIMKIAAVLHVFSRHVTSTTIADKYVKAAIHITNELLEANLKLCQDKGILGAKAEFTSILSLFEKDRRPRTERNIIQSKSSNLPFSELNSGKSAAIKSALNAMVEQGLLARSVVVRTIYYAPAQ